MSQSPSQAKKTINDPANRNLGRSYKQEKHSPIQSEPNLTMESLVDEKVPATLNIIETMVQTSDNRVSS